MATEPDRLTIHVPAIRGGRPRARAGRPRPPARAHAWPAPSRWCWYLGWLSSPAASATRCCSASCSSPSSSTSCRRSGSGGPAPCPAAGGADRRRRDRRRPAERRDGRRASSRRTTNRSEIVEPTVAAAMRLRGATVRVLPARRRQPAGDAAARRPVGRALRASERPQRGQGGQHQPRARAHLVHVRRRARLRPRAGPDASSSARCRRSPTRPVGLRPDAAVLRERGRQHRSPRRRGASRRCSSDRSRGQGRPRSMFCCGTNVVFRRAALDRVGGFPENSLTEDFELSLGLHEAGWSSSYVPEVLASGLGPEDLASYVSQQHRWARGCVSAIPACRPLRSAAAPEGAVPAVGVVLPVRLDRARVPVAAGDPDHHRAAADRRRRRRRLPRPLRRRTSASPCSRWPRSGRARYTFSAYALSTSTFWVHVHATCKAIFHRPGRFVVTPKVGDVRPPVATRRSHARRHRRARRRRHLRAVCVTRARRR